MKHFLHIVESIDTLFAFCQKKVNHFLHLTKKLNLFSHFVKNRYTLASCQKNSLTFLALLIILFYEFFVRNLVD